MNDGFDERAEIDEGSLLCSPVYVVVVGDGHLTTGFQALSLEVHQLVGAFEWKSPKNGPVHDAEHGRGKSDAERQRGDRVQRETAMFH